MFKKNTEHVRGLVSGIIGKLEKGSVKKANAVTDAWCRAVDDNVKGHAKPVSFKKGVLVVIVESAPWLYQLTFNKKKILEKFNSEYTGRNKGVDIRFRVGELES